MHTSTLIILTSWAVLTPYLTFSRVRERTMETRRCQTFPDLRLYWARVSHLAMQKASKTQCRLQSLNSNNLLRTGVETLKRRRSLLSKSNKNSLVGSGDFSEAANSQISQLKISMRIAAVSWMKILSQRSEAIQTLKYLRRQFRIGPRRWIGQMNLRFYRGSMGTPSKMINRTYLKLFCQPFHQEWGQIKPIQDSLWKP
jgi:hypothetical protein